MVHKASNSLIGDNFTDNYFFLHDYLYTEGDTVKSRNGTTKEILNFKTTLHKPTNRCIAGYNRNINIFFLMAEAMWIFKGRRDVEFLDIFNSKIKDYSDDGKFYHGAYGWRLRKYGVSSTTEIESSNLPYFSSGTDQILTGLEMLNVNPEDRRVVLAIWNEELDLNVKSKDICCNDMLMFKIRDGKLHQTIQNRSNDLNWGLTTNVFQFSFIGEVMSILLGVEYGTQTHNSQSLHLYVENAMGNLTEELQKEFMSGDYELFKEHDSKLMDFDLYKSVRHLPIEFKFKEDNLPMVKRLYWVDFYLHAMILKLTDRNKNGVTNMEDEELFSSELKLFCYHFWVIYQLLCIYVDYKKHKDHITAINELISFNLETGVAKYDIFLLSLNFFMQRLKNKDQEVYEDILTQVRSYIPIYRGIQIGKL